MPLLDAVTPLPLTQALDRAPQARRASVGLRCRRGLIWLAGLCLAGGGGPALAQTPGEGAAVAAALAASAPPSAPAGWPPLPYAPAVAARYPDPAVRAAVPALQPGRAQPTSQAELAAALAQAAARAAPGTRVELLSPGASQLGVPLAALRFSRGPGRPLVLLVGQQHGDEPAGAEALVALARELASGGPASTALDKLDVLLLPRLNVDGAAVASRVSANGMDINRDHLLLRTPEARALAELVRWQRPVLVLDHHEYSVLGRYLQKFGGVQRFDVLYQHATTANLPPELAQAAEAWFHRPIALALAAEGHSLDWYYTNPTASAERGLSMGGVQPDIGRNVYGLRHAVSLLIETRGVGLGPWHLARRVHSHLVVMRSALAQAARRANALVALQAQADAQVAALACQGMLVVQAETTPQPYTLLMLDPVTGGDISVPVQWASALQLRTLRERQRPCGYWLAADQAPAVAALQTLGVQTRRLVQAEAWQTERYEEAVPGQGPRPDVRGQSADGGRPVLRVQVSLQPERFEAPAGSWYVPLDQPRAHLATAALEPDTPSSYRAHGLVDRADAVRRVLQRPVPVPPPGAEPGLAVEPLPSPLPLPSSPSAPSAPLPAASAAQPAAAGAALPPVAPGVKPGSAP